MKIVPTIASTLAILLSLFMLSGCIDNPADVASRNLSLAADNFQVTRRIVFYNGITDSYMLTIEGLCSLGNNDSPGTVSITCQTGQGQYKKHFLGLSDNVTFFVEQLEPSSVSTYYYKVMFRPQTIIPDVDMDIDLNAK